MINTGIADAVTNTFRVSYCTKIHINDIKAKLNISAKREKGRKHKPQKISLSKNR